MLYCLLVSSRFACSLDLLWAGSACLEKARPCMIAQVAFLLLVLVLAHTGAGSIAAAALAPNPNNPYPGQRSDVGRFLAGSTDSLFSTFFSALNSKLWI